jgi:ribulose-phosphate 3-epimerase
MAHIHEVIPAIMPDSYEDMLSKADAVLGSVSWVQIDVMDGFFVPSTSWPYDAEGLVSFHDMVKNGEKLPYLDELSYEIDLMVEHPEDEVARWSSFGAKRFLVHFESLESIDALEHIILNYRKVGESEVGIALGVETPIDSITPILQEIDCVQLMGIAKIGYQRQEFDKRVIDNIQRLREVYKDGIISVDGGVSFETAPQLLAAGVDRLVSGSTIFGSDDISSAIQKLQGY